MLRFHRDRWQSSIFEFRHKSGSNSRIFDQNRVCMVRVGMGNGARSQGREVEPFTQHVNEIILFLMIEPRGAYRVVI